MLLPSLLAILAAAQLTPPTAYDYKQVQLAASGKSVAATFVWQNKVMFSSSTDNGALWTEPSVVGEAPALAAGRHRGPRIAFSEDAIVITFIAGKSEKRGADGDLFAYRSTDRGKTWKQTARINDVVDAAREGLHAMASGSKGFLYTAWLDLRKPGTRLYGSASRDGGLTWSANEEIYQSPEGTICQCCHPSLAIDSHDVIHVMWRNVIDGNRDFYLASSKDGGKHFSVAEKMGIGSWKLNACPMDGGDLVIAENGKPVTVWRREDAIYVAIPGELEREVHVGKDPSIALARDGTYFAWRDDQGIEVRTPGKVEPSLLDADGAYPQLLTLQDGTVLAAWEHKGQIRFERLR